MSSYPSVRRLFGFDCTCAASYDSRDFNHPQTQGKTPGGSLMKAVYITEHGGVDKLIHGDRPDPEVGPGEIMLRVRASALNHLDLNLRAGTSYNGPLPRTLGCDIAGEVTTISPQANTSLKVGDRVILNNRVTCGVCDACNMGLDQSRSERPCHSRLNGFCRGSSPAHRCSHCLALPDDSGSNEILGYRIGASRRFRSR